MKRFESKQEKTSPPVVFYLRTMLVSPVDVLKFWFGENYVSGGISERNNVGYIRSRSPLWFQSQPEFEQTQKDNVELLNKVERAHLKDTHNLTDWNGPQGTLAKIIVFDQFPRCIFRGTVDAFKYDEYAQQCVSTILSNDEWFMHEYSVAERWFITLPLQHSEDLSKQELSVHLTSTMCDDIEDGELKGFVKSMDHYASEHYEAVKRFGRFPGRNNALGRESTEEEIAWLNSPECPGWAKSQQAPSI